VVQQRRSQRGNPRWLVKPSMCVDDIRIAVLMDGRTPRGRAYYVFPSRVLQKEHTLLSPLNPADIETFRSNGLERFFDLCARRDVGQCSPLAQPDDEKLSQTAVPPLRARPRCPLLTRPLKTYSGAFLHASKRMRAAFSRANATDIRLKSLRDTVARLLSDAPFRRLLSAQGIGNVPTAVDRTERYVEQTEAQTFRAKLREAAVELLSVEPTNLHTRDLLGKLARPWRVQAAELIVLAADRTEYFARALVLTSPMRAHLIPSRAHCNSSPRQLKWMLAERTYMYQEARRVFASFGRSALELVAVEAFARRLATTPVTVEWLERHDREALCALRSCCANGRTLKAARV